MKKVSVTRMELLARKAQIALARQGRELLEQKRTALMKEFLRIADTVMERSDALQQAAINARKALARAEAIAGTEAVKSASLISRAELPLQVATAIVMGVKVPHIEQKRVARRLMKLLQHSRPRWNRSSIWQKVNYVLLAWLQKYNTHPGG